MQLSAEPKPRGVALDALEEQQHLQAWEQDANYKALYEEKSARILTLSDGIVKVYDATAGKMVGSFRLLQLNGDFLILKGRFLKDLVFSRANFTDYIFVHDKANNAVEIIEQ